MSFKKWSYYNLKVRQFTSADDMQYLDARDEIAGYNLFAYCNKNPVMGYDPTGNWDWGGVAIGSGLMIAAAIAAAFRGISSGAGAVAIGGVFTAGAVTAYSGVTDSVMVMDISGSAPFLIPYGGLGIGYSIGPSAAVGLVGNYEKTADYEEFFVDVNAGYWLGMDHCRILL